MDKNREKKEVKMCAAFESKPSYSLQLGKVDFLLKFIKCPGGLAHDRKRNDSGKCYAGIFSCLDNFSKTCKFMFWSLTVHQP